MALLAERRLDLDVTQAVVAPGTARAAMARLSCAFYDFPARSLVTRGGDGDDGKTTVTHLLAAIFEAHRWRTTVIGTLDGARTTPESPVLQRLLAEARDGGGRAVAMEVSSHALVQARTDGIVFDAAVFTNLSHDHLDYHGTLEAYFAAKATLFTPEHAALGVVNADDPWGRRLLEQASVPTVAFTMDEVDDIDSAPDHTSFTWRGLRVELALAGSLHVANALAAATTATALGIAAPVVAAGLGTARPVTGRFEVLPGAGDVTVVVDYAHTPDGLRTALDSARRLAGAHRVLCVFGCGGGRDHDKRPVMGAVAATLADVAVLTSDNPRHEDPGAIIAEVLAGVSDRSASSYGLSAREAIDLAVDLARPGDVVLVAGKGHETVIDFGDHRVPFDDAAVAGAALERRFGPAGATPGASR